MRKTRAITIRSLILLPAFLWIFSSLGGAATIQVDCSSASLQAAVDEAKPGDTLLVSGTCKENLVIYEEVARITLDGQGKSTIEGPDAGGRTIEVRGRGITIKGFTITGGRAGLVVTRGGQAIVDGNTVQGAARYGIVIMQSSSARIGNNTVKNNGNGIVIENTSAGRVGYFSARNRTASPNTIENNERNGIVVNFGSSARIVGNTIRNNKRTGISVSRASSQISSNTIDGNGRGGILIQNSNVSLGRRRGSGIFQLPNSTTSNNSTAGIRCVGNSSVSGRLGSLKGEEEVKDIDPSCVDSLKP